MPDLSGIYDSAPIQPVCQIKENLSIFTGSQWRHFQCMSMDAVEGGRPTIVDMVTQAAVVGRVSLVAAGTFAKEVVAVLQLNQTEFLHFRFEPLDPIEVAVWQISGQPKGMIKRLQARADMNTRINDPYLASTTCFIYGQDRDINFETFNPTAYVLPTARFKFWGFRADLDEYSIDYLLERNNKPASEKNRWEKLLAAGDKDAVKTLIGATRWLPAEQITKTEIYAG